VLLIIAEHDGMSFGDGGALAVVIRLEDLAAGEYERVVAAPSMG
jgi:hypothetical protein